MYKLKDQFTTIHGHWYVENEKYGIKQEMLDKYEKENIPGKGSAIGFFVKLEGGPAKEVHFETTAGHIEDKPIDSTRWANITMYNPGSGYDPTVQDGPWFAHAKDAPSEVIDGVGLPEGHHVSTFSILEWVEGGENDDGEDDDDQDPDPGDGPDIPDKPDEEEGVMAITIMLGREDNRTVYKGVVVKQ
jgi:hypothetical protein